MSDMYTVIHGSARTAGSTAYAKAPEKGRKGKKMAKKTQTSEYCSLGHPDRMCDYIASYILDRHLEKDPRSRVALEVQLKGCDCTVSGEISSRVRFTKAQLSEFVRDAIYQIGYDREYQEEFGEENAICCDDVETVFHITHQSQDIAQGVDADGWGDQGIFWGLAVDEPETGYMPKDCFLARKLAQSIAGRLGGRDVKTLVTLSDGKPVECFIAIPLPPGASEAPVIEEAEAMMGEDCRIVLNGTGRYVKHGPSGDCGTTGRKLVVDFYGGNSRIGGGSPWGKDPTKADVTLNVLARRYALEGMKRYGLPEMRCSISCCIGRREIRVTLYDARMEEIETRLEDEPASHVISKLGLDRPVYAEMCANGMFLAEKAR